MREASLRKRRKERRTGIYKTVIYEAVLWYNERP